MARSDDQIEDLEFDIGRSASDSTTRISERPEESSPDRGATSDGSDAAVDDLEFDLSSTRPPVPHPPSVPSRSSIPRVPVGEIDLGDPALPTELELPPSRGLDRVPDATESLEPFDQALDLEPSVPPGPPSRMAPDQSPPAPTHPLSAPLSANSETALSSESLRSLEGRPSVSSNPSPRAAKAAVSPTLARETGNLPEIPELEVEPPRPTRAPVASRSPERTPRRRSQAPMSLDPASALVSPSSAPTSPSSAPASPASAPTSPSSAPTTQAGGSGRLSTRPAPNNGASRARSSPALSSPNQSERSKSIPLATGASQHDAAFGNLGNLVDLGGFDDWDFGGTQATQFQMAAPLPQQDDEVGWPLGRTPFEDELSIDPETIARVAGFGTAPSTFLGTPFYFLRVQSGLKRVDQERPLAKKTLADAEAARDDLLARLGESARHRLGKSERFAPLYATADAKRSGIGAHEQSLKNADLEGSQELSAVQVKLDRLSAEERERQRSVDEQRLAWEQCERDIHRTEAALKRLDIEERNLEDRRERAPRSTNFDERFATMEQQRAELEEHLTTNRGKLAQLRETLRHAEDLLKRATADRQTCEGQKEGILLALQGELAEYSRALDDAVHEHEQAMAAIGRSIVEMRGQIPVDKKTRERLHSADAAVKQAALRVKTLSYAPGSMDRDAYQKGKLLWIAAALVLVGLLVYSAL